MRNETIVENTDAYRQPFTVLMVSLFLLSHTAQQHKELMQARNTTMSQFITSIKRKLPDRIDIFNKKNETEFVQLMQGDFLRIIAEELQALKCFLPREMASATVNDQFNYVEDADFGNISLANLQFLVKHCFFPEWLPRMDALYRLFVQDSPFSLRNFLVSLVLMSHCTVSEKFDVLYDLFDWNDGVADGLDMNSMFLLVKTIFERNLYYWPSHELFNLVELAFDLSTAALYQALWTREVSTQGMRTPPKLGQVLAQPSLAEQGGTIDVTEEVQETVNSY